MYEGVYTLCALIKNVHYPTSGTAKNAEVAIALSVKKCESYI